MAKKKAGMKCPITGWSPKQWLGTLISLGATYGFLYLLLQYLGDAGNIGSHALILLVLGIIAWWACPCGKEAC